VIRARRVCATPPTNSRGSDQPSARYAPVQERWPEIKGHAGASGDFRRRIFRDAGMPPWPLTRIIEAELQHIIHAPCTARRRLIYRCGGPQWLADCITNENTKQITVTATEF